MPYNTTAIPPRKEVTGQNLLPLLRVKRIIAADPDVTVCSTNAAFLITLAASYDMTRVERKQRRNVQYKDVANAVSYNDNLEFLEDLIPRTVPYKKIKEQAAVTRAQLMGEKSANGSRSPTAQGARVSRGGAEHQSNGADSFSFDLRAEPRIESQSDDIVMDG